MIQSRQNLTSEYKYWFQKTNYMGKFLSKKSLNIIKSIINGNKNK